MRAADWINPRSPRAFWLTHQQFGCIINTYTQKGLEMKAFIVGTVFGLILATVGFSGLARMVDNGVSKVQDISKEAAK